MKKIVWTIRPQGEPMLSRRCPKCGHMDYENSGCFRVNANGRRLDVWLIYRCAACKATWNLTVMERVDPKTIERGLYEKFLANDRELALRYGLDAQFLKRNDARLDREALELEIEGERPDAAGEYEIELVPDPPMDLPVLRVMAQGLELSQSAVKRLYDGGALLSDWELKKAKLTKNLVFRYKKDEATP